MERARASWPGVLVLLSFVGVALAQTWPLPLHLTDRLTGNVSGDTAVYVWNTWVFRRELLEVGHSPFSTDTIFALGGPADLSLHNYTVFADLLAIPLQPLLGIVGAFNVVFLLNFALAGFGMFVLTRHLMAASVERNAIAWLAGLLFACSPFLVSRGNGHFSVAAAAPIPFFALYLYRTLARQRMTDAALAGACVAWAAYCDPYHAIYCVMLGAALLIAKSDFRTERRVPRARLVVRVIDVLAAFVVAAMMTSQVFGVGSLRVGSVSISMRTLYTPMLVLTILVIGRMLLVFRIRAEWHWPPFMPFARALAVMIGVTATLLAPQLYAIAMRASEGRMVKVPVLWRSSAPGVDLLALFAPNPNHPLAPKAMVDWILRQPGENVASLPWVSLLVLAAAWGLTRVRPNRAWAAITLVFAWMSLGPFIRIGGFESGIPTPWTLLRFVPLFGEARMPARFSVLVILGVAVLFAGALAALLQRYPARRRTILAVVTAGLAFELLAAPRPLYRLEIPAIYETVARDPRPLRVLHLPFGLRDGLTTYGQFNAAALVQQTQHGKGLVSGYLSRVSDQRKEAYLSHPTLAALLALVEGTALSPAQREAALAAAPDLVSQAQIGWAVIDEQASRPALRDFAIEAFGLTFTEREGHHALFTVTGPPGAGKR